MLGIEQLQTIARKVTPIAMDIYDKADVASLLPLIARVVPPNGEETVRLEWWAAFPEMRQWLDERVLQKAFQDDMTLTVVPYEITYSYDRLKATFETGLASAQDLASTIAQGFASGKVLKAYEPMRSNELAYDGQDFFDTDHTHPDGSTFSNVVSFNRGTTTTPTVEEAKAELQESIARLAQNSIIRNRLIETSKMVSDIVVVAKSFAVWKAYDSLLTEERIGSEINRFRGAFRLLRDYDPATSTDDYVDVIHALPGGPRPSIFVPHKEVAGLEFGLVDPMKRHVPFGMSAMYAFGPGFPQAAVRVIPS